MSLFTPEFEQTIKDSIFNTEIGSAIIGAIITALAVCATILWEACKIKRQGKDDLRAVCGAIKTELEGVLEQYKEVRETVEGLKENESYGQNYRIDQDYFSVFHGNTASIGKLPDPVRTDVVLAYTKMKSLVDTFKENNHILESYERFVLENTRVTIINGENVKLREHFLDVIKNYQVNMVSMGESLKDVSSEAVKSANKAIKSLESYLS